VAYIVGVIKTQDVSEEQKCAISLLFIVGECILLRMYQISKYKQPSFTTVLKRALYNEMFRLMQSHYQVLSHTEY
jgi:hypothetical protein